MQGQMTRSNLKQFLQSFKIIIISIIVSDSKKDDEDEENLFDEDFDMEVKATQRKPW